MTSNLREFKEKARKKKEAFWSNPNADYDEQKMKELFAEMLDETGKEARKQWNDKGGEPWNYELNECKQLCKDIRKQKMKEVDPKYAEDFGKFWEHRELQMENYRKELQRDREWGEVELPKQHEKNIRMCEAIEKLYAEGMFDDETPSEKNERIRGYEAKSLEHFYEMTKKDAMMRKAKKMEIK